MKSGTPRTLNQAIRNALEEAKDKIIIGINVEVSNLVESHVRDFLAQKFAVPIIELGGTEEAVQTYGMEALRLESLWYEITGRKIETNPDAKSDKRR